MLCPMAPISENAKSILTCIEIKVSLWQQNNLERERMGKEKGIRTDATMQTWKEREVQDEKRP